MSAKLRDREQEVRELLVGIVPPGVFKRVVAIVEELEQAEPNEGAPPVAVRVLLDELLAYVDLGGPCMVERAAHLDSVGLCGAEYGFTVTATHQRTGERTDIDILVPYGLWMKPNARFLFHGRRHAWVESIDGLREHFGKQERFGRPEG